MQILILARRHHIYMITLILQYFSFVFILKFWQSVFL